MPTSQHDAWVKDTFDLDPARYDAPQSGAAPLGYSEHDAALAKALQVWVATRKTIENNITSLQGKVAEAYKGHTMAQELEDAFVKRVAPVMGTFDDSLAHQLNTVIQSADVHREQSISAVRAVISSYVKFLDSDDVIDHLDKNPVMPLTIRKTLDSALEGIAKALG